MTDTDNTTQIELHLNNLKCGMYW